MLFAGTVVCVEKKKKKRKKGKSGKSRSRLLGLGRAPSHYAAATFSSRFNPPSSSKKGIKQDPSAPRPHQ